VRGDGAAARTDVFDGFVRSNYVGLIAFGLLLTGQQAVAEDLVQEALARTLLRSQRQLPDNLDAYVRRVMINTYTAWWRRLLRRERPVEAPPEPDPEEFNHAERLTYTRALHHALNRLSRGQRAVVVLGYYEHRTQKEIAELLGCSVGTVKSQQHDALNRLRADQELAAAFADEEARS
jgi:RNA polymerase sigma-70 factor (sigma-E family)